MKKLGFIGSGKMAGAIIKGIVKSEFISSENIIATQLEPETILQKSKELGVKVILDNVELTKCSDVIFIAVKPNQVLDILSEISEYITSDKLVVSIATGITTEKLEANLLNGSRVVRVMPNTPALLGEGMSGIVAGKNATQEDSEYVERLFNTIGKTIVVNNESQMDIVTAISGSGPAFFYKVINDIARAGEKLGLDYEKALLLSTQTSLGAAKMVFNREISVEELISNVATKGGCTRVGVDVMENIDTAKVFSEVISKTTEKASQLGK